MDEDTLAFYQSLKGELGERLKKCICTTDETPHFILGEDGRCPFLNKDNLCDIILAHGEGALCDICSDHPRFYNEFSDRTEAGVGLCCEAAGTLILSRTEKVQLVSSGAEEEADEEEMALLQLRDMLLEIAQDRTLPVEERMKRILDACCISLPQASFAEWAAVYEGLERLDPAWEENLLALKTRVPAPLGEAWEILSEQLLHYFIYRHLPGALEDGCIAERAAFAVLSVKIIRAMLGLAPEPAFEDAVEISRRYSAEIEYSDENIDALLSALSQA